MAITPLQPGDAPANADMQAHDAELPLPDFPVGMSAEMAGAVERYRAAYIADDAEEWRLAAVAVAALSARTLPDLAAKLMIGLHELYPGGVGALLIGVEHFPTDASKDIMLGLLTDALALAPVVKPNDSGVEAFAQALSVYEAAVLPLKAEGLSDDEIDRLGDIETETLEALFAVPAPDFAAVAAKLRAFLAGYATPHDDILAGILADAERLTGNTDEAIIADLRAKGMVGPISRAFIAGIRLDREFFAVISKIDWTPKKTEQLKAALATAGITLKGEA